MKELNAEAPTLRVTLKKKWFDMEQHPDPKLRKDEEYREIKPYWIKRLLDFSDYPKEDKSDGKNNAEDIMFDLENHTWEDVIKGYYAKFKAFDVYEAKHGYAKDAPILRRECLGISIGSAKPEWSDNWQGNVFIIKLGEKLSEKGDKGNG